MQQLAFLEFAPQTHRNEVCRVERPNLGLPRDHDIVRKTSVTSVFLTNSRW
jgi:hypothetical protein